MSNKYFESRLRQSGKTNDLAQELKLIRDSIVVGFGVPPAFVGSEESSSNRTTLSIDVAKVEETRRREYEKVEQVNAMYKAAKALGFPEKVSLDVKYQLPYYVIVSVHRCFDLKYYAHAEYDNGSLCFFYRLRFEPSDIESLYDQICVAPDGGDIPKFVVWLLVCMKLFYKKDWDGRKWIDEKEGFTKYEDSFTTYSEASQVSNLRVEVVKKLAEQLAYDIDNEIMKAMVKDPESWKVQVGNVVYGIRDRINVLNLIDWSGMKK